ncbi:endo-1,3-alpha-glucanase family glycosylhydrolase [Streptosporangium sp. NBC_01756]|uniref:endo-1,3-alpha-glucanase family glycosylhydrolase n=1 Tax=Streptosporangium sp. NBC_01756 TaxID=2975950 RepID=UPI002DD83E05|nr:endo-1,3-alpha-glucanase family glycosylhydrolase [Streptosporangium sp. NBC_01756]WSC90113.1 endo-1,3-alpha-glucanase family glycosylhydrolase [Streptosporangium sp. NBC_01756]
MFSQGRAALAVLVALVCAIPLGAAQASAQSAPVSVVVQPAKDVFISQIAPTTIYGTAEWLSVCVKTCNDATNAERRTLTGFTVAGIPANATNVTMTLQVQSTRTTDTTVAAHKVTGTWSETTTSWNNKPTFGAALSTHTGFTANTAAGFDVSDAYTGNGAYSFGLTASSGPVAVLYSTRTTGKGPSLKITYTPGTATPTPTPSATPSATPTATPTTTPPAGSSQCLPFDKPSAATLRSYDKKVFAFYFPPYPLSIDNKDPSKDQYASWLDPAGSNGMYAAQGGHSRDRPLTRPVRSGNWRQADFEVEIRQAIAMGLDGFIYEHHTSASDQRFNHIADLLAAAKAVDPGFRIMLSPDFPTTKDASPDKPIADLLLAKGHPSVYHLPDGTIPLAPFYPERQSPAWWDNLRAKLAEQGMKTSLVPIFLDWSGSGKTEWNNSVVGYSSWGVRWESSTDGYRKAGIESQKRGRFYMAPAALEDVRPRDKRYWEPSNSNTLRQSFVKAMEGDADIISLLTWNDYAESWLAPSVERGYAPADVIAYYTTWFKTGKAPSVARDALYYFHRSHRTDAPFDKTKQTIGPIAIPYGDAATNNVELLAFVKSAGTLVVKQGTDVQTKEVTAPGMVSFKVPMVPGTTPVFELKRDGKTVQTVTSKTPIEKSVVYQDLINHAGGGAPCSRPL